MIKYVVLVSLLAFLNACAHHAAKDSSPLEFDDDSKTSVSAAKKAEPAKTKGIVVDSKDLAVLEKMNKAVEAYVLKNEKKQFTSLCKDKRFDCFVDEKAYPHSKKKIARKVPPYASGSKMGLQGEARVHVKYDFYP